jgi:hypothetical protein
MDTESTQTAPTPVLSAFMVCDNVIEDKLTNKKSLIGVFTDIRAITFPYVHYCLGIYVCLTDAEGEYELNLRLVHADSGIKIGEAGLMVMIADRLSMSDFAINLSHLVFPEPGRYEFQLYANRQFLGLKAFRLSAPPPDDLPPSS